MRACSPGRAAESERACEAAGGSHAAGPGCCEASVVVVDVDDDADVASSAYLMLVCLTAVAAVCVCCPCAACVCLGRAER